MDIRNKSQEEYNKLLEEIKNKGMLKDIWLIGGSSEEHGFMGFIVRSSSGDLTIDEAYLILNGE